jgi:hypothetical protein
MACHKIQIEFFGIKPYAWTDMSFQDGLAMVPSNKKSIHKLRISKGKDFWRKNTTEEQIISYEMVKLLNIVRQRVD